MNEYTVMIYDEHGTYVAEFDIRALSEDEATILAASMTNLQHVVVGK